MNPKVTRAIGKLLDAITELEASVKDLQSQVDDLLHEVETERLSGETLMALDTSIPYRLLSGEPCTDSEGGDHA